MQLIRASVVLMLSAAVLLHAAQPVAGQEIRNERLKILAGDGAEADWFSFSSVAIHGSTAIVGAYGDDDNGFASGSAYLFDVATGVQIAKLLPADGAAGDAFGIAVAICGLTAIVGARHDDDNGTNSGSAYLFDVATATQIVKLLPSDGAAGEEFGRAVAISWSNTIVGAPRDNDKGTDSGSAYLFDVATGTQTAKLLASDGAMYDRFGGSVATSESIAIVGAAGDDDNGTNSGSAYLFDVVTGTQLVQLLPGDGAAGDEFGDSVAISGSTAIVGASRDDDNGSTSGSAYLFDVPTGTQITKLLPSDGATDDFFGRSVAISGSTAIVGAFSDSTPNGSDSGSAYLFDVATGTQIVKLLPRDGARVDEFGESVAIHGSTAIVGAHLDDDNGLDSGSAYLFDANGFTLDFFGACPGQSTFNVTNATPGGPVAIVNGLGDGPVTIPSILPCAGTVLNIGAPQLSSRIIVADAGGVAVLNVNVPAAACGRVRVQALDLTTCETSDVVRP